MVLIKMKKIAETYLGKKIISAVITVPASYNIAQRQAIKDVGTISGLKVVRILSQSTAAAIAYGFENIKEEIKNIMVFDLGGGNFDISIVTIEKGVFEVITTNRDTHLGGQDFDNNVIEYFIKLINKKNNVDISGNKRAIQKLKIEVEKAKIQLS